MRKNYTVLLLILIVILGLANYFGPYFSSQLPTFPNSAFLPTPRQTIEPTLPPSHPPSQQELSESSEPASPIKITPPSPSVSAQPVSNLKLSAYSLDPLTNRFMPLTAIDWSAEGPIILGQIRNSPRIYFRNEGDVPVTLQLSSSGWIFEDSAGRVLVRDYRQYFSLGWDYDNFAIAVNETRPITFTLTVSLAAIGVARFSFDTIVALTY